MLGDLNHSPARSARSSDGSSGRRALPIDVSAPGGRAYFRTVRSPPEDLIPERLTDALAEGWGLSVAAMKYVPEGGGSHHWKSTAADGEPHFVTVDDLDTKDWLGLTRDSVFHGLGRALDTAGVLRHRAGLDFVLAAVAAHNGDQVRRLDARYAISAFPFLAGRSFPFGDYPDSGLRDSALDLVIALHRSTAAVRELAPRHVLNFEYRPDLEAFLLDPDRRWDGGPFSEPARRLLAGHAPEVAHLASVFRRLVALTARTQANPVITHGEPHPANLMSAGGRLYLIDWDTVALACPERDLAVIISPDDEGVERYQQATGRVIDPAAMTLYRLRWYLDDLASAVRLLRNPHHDTPDTRQCQQALEPQLEQLSNWRDVLAGF